MWVWRYGLFLIWWFYSLCRSAPAHVYSSIVRVYEYEVVWVSSEEIRVRLCLSWQGYGVHVARSSYSVLGIPLRGWILVVFWPLDEQVMLVFCDG